MNDTTSLIALFCDIDDFCKTFLPAWHRRQLASGERKRRRAPGLGASELMTILVHFHQSQYREGAQEVRRPPRSRRPGCFVEVCGSIAGGDKT